MKSYEYKSLKYLSTNTYPVTDVMLSYIETLRRIGKFEPHE